MVKEVVRLCHLVAVVFEGKTPNYQLARGHLSVHVDSLLEGTQGQCKRVRCQQFNLSRCDPSKLFNQYRS